MILGFKTKFKDGWPTHFEKSILACMYPKEYVGSPKIHTIRKDSRDRWKVGRKIHFATGVRTKHYRQFCEGEVKGIQYVKFMLVPADNSNYLTAMVFNSKNENGKYIDVMQLAVNDGFFYFRDFYKWFEKEEGNLLKIIHWTDFKY